MINLERLVCGHLHLSTVLTMFADPCNIPSLQDFVDATVKVCDYVCTLHTVYIYMYMYNSDPIILGPNTACRSGHVQ